MSQVLHPIEHKIIRQLRDSAGLTYDELAIATKLTIDQVRRGLEWLKYKNLIEIKESEIFFVSLGRNGKDALEKGLPERRLVNYVAQQKVRTLDEARTILPDSEPPASRQVRALGTGLADCPRNCFTAS